MDSGEVWPVNGTIKLNATLWSDLCLHSPGMWVEDEASDQFVLSIHAAVRTLRNDPQLRATCKPDLPGIATEPERKIYPDGKKHPPNE